MRVATPDDGFDADGLQLMRRQLEGLRLVLCEWRFHKVSEPQKSYAVRKIEPERPALDISLRDLIRGLEIRWDGCVKKLKREEVCCELFDRMLVSHTVNLNTACDSSESDDCYGLCRGAT